MTEQREGENPLPELHDALLDAQTVVVLFRDIAACTEVIEVLPRFADRQRVGEQGITIEEGQVALLSGEARAVRLRYRYQGTEWWDTVMALPGGSFRIVRIEHSILA